MRCTRPCRRAGWALPEVSFGVGANCALSKPDTRKDFLDRRLARGVFHARAPGHDSTCRKSHAKSLAGTTAIAPMALVAADFPDAPVMGRILPGLDAAKTGAQSHWLAGTTHLERAFSDLELVCDYHFALQRGFE